MDRLCRRSAVQTGVQQAEGLEEQPKVGWDECVSARRARVFAARVVWVGGWVCVGVCVCVCVWDCMGRCVCLFVRARVCDCSLCSPYALAGTAPRDYLDGALRLRARMRPLL